MELNVAGKKANFSKLLRKHNRFERFCYVLCLPAVSLKTLYKNFYCSAIDLSIRVFVRLRLKPQRTNLNKNQEMICIVEFFLTITS